MLDSVIRPLIDRPLNAGGRALARAGVSANAITVAGLIPGLLAALAILHEAYWAAFGLIIVNRIVDGLDGAAARATRPTDVGGYLDIVADYVFYASVPLAFALVDPQANAVPAAALLASFCLTCSTFLAFAIVAAKRNLTTETHGRKSFFYSQGVVEGTETIAFFLLMTLTPDWFVPLAWMFVAGCVITAVQRSLLALRLFRT